MVKTFSKIKKFKSLGARRVRGNPIEKRKERKMKDKLRAKKENIRINISLYGTLQLPINTCLNSKLSSLSKDKIYFLISEGDNILNDYLIKENEEFVPNIPMPATLNKKRTFLIYCFYELKKNITNMFNYKFPDNFAHSVIALFDFFLNKSNKEMKTSYMGRTMYACIDIIDKEEGLRVFLNEGFQQQFTTDDEIDVLEATDFKLYPVKPFDYFSHFYFNANVFRKSNSNFLNYLEILKNSFNEKAYIMLINEKTKQKKPSINYFSILKMAYEETKNLEPNGDNFINDYMDAFKNIINYCDEDYSLAEQQFEQSVHLFNEAKMQYEKIYSNQN